MVRKLHCRAVTLCGTKWDKLDSDRFHHGHRACPATRKDLQRGYMTCPWDKERSLLTFPSPSGTGLRQAQPVPLTQAQPVPICLSHWDRLCLSQWLVPVGQVWYRHHPSKAGPWPSLGSFLIKNQRGPNRIPEIPYQKSVSNWSKIETKNRFVFTKLTQNVLPKGRREQANKGEGLSLWESRVLLPCRIGHEHHSNHDWAFQLCCVLLWTFSTWSTQRICLLNPCQPKKW